MEANRSQIDRVKRRAEVLGGGAYGVVVAAGSLPRGTAEERAKANQVTYWALAEMGFLSEVAEPVGR